MSRAPALLLGLVLVAFGGRAGACVNDSELESHEREFRSQYGQWAGVEPAEAKTFRAIRHDVLAAGGAVLLIGALGLAAKRDRARA